MAGQAVTCTGQASQRQDKVLHSQEPELLLPPCSPKIFDFHFSLQIFPILLWVD